MNHFESFSSSIFNLNDNRNTGGEIYVINKRKYL